jgi:predicted peptidase
MRTRLAVALIAAITVAAAARGDDAKSGFLDKKFKNDDDTMSPYVVFVPAGYDGSKAVPVILFLHGAGETKGGQKMPAEVGLGPHIKGRREKTFPAIVVFPQSEKRTWQADSPDAKRAIAMLDATMKEYKCDPARVYLTGLSMGGYGTWSNAAGHADRWAAIVPVCGGVRGGSSAEDNVAEKIKDIPCWVWHGDKDPAVPVDLSREMVAALKKAGGNPRYTELAWITHSSWDAAYASDDLYAWLFAQKKK